MAKKQSERGGAAAKESRAQKKGSAGGGKAKPKVRRPKKAPTGDEQVSVRRGRARGRPMRGKSRRHLENVKKVEKHKQYPMEEGIKLLKEVAGGTKFTQSVNLVMNLGIDPKHADQMIRGALSLPKGIGKTKRVVAFCDGEDGEKAKAAGAIEVGIEDLVKKVSDGWMEFDVAIAHPRAMSKVGKLGRLLGPQGKMPTPKNGTVTPDVEEAVRDFVAGKIEFRNDAGGNIHAVVGKVDFPDEDLEENIKAFIDHIRKLKPSASKGTYIKKVFIGGTMSPAVQLQVAQ
jgi:large subunit ribosomal protein L1